MRLVAHGEEPSRDELGAEARKRAARAIRCYRAPVAVRRETRPESALLLLIAAAGCGSSEPDAPPAPAWEIVERDLPGALLSVWGTSANDAWAVGGDARDGTGPVVLHRDESGWKRLETGLDQGNLWWVFGFAAGPVYLGGDGGTILRYAAGEFSRMSTPGEETVFGIWGSSPDDVWAVGGAQESDGGFAWRLREGGDAWLPEPSLPAQASDGAAIWKVFGRAAGDAWLVGSNGVALHWDGEALVPGQTGVGSSLFTVHANASRYAAVGGLGSGVIVEYEADEAAGGVGGAWRDVTPADAPLSLTGVCLGQGDAGVAVGAFGGVYLRGGSGWQRADLGFTLNESLHGVWIDPSEGIWAVGGQTFSEPLTDGLMIHRPPTPRASP